MKKVVVYNAAGYVGMQLLVAVARHPRLQLLAATSRSFAGQPLAAADPRYAGLLDGHFVAPEQAPIADADAVLLAAEHGQAEAIVARLLDGGYNGVIVDLSADFRLRNADDYPRYYGREHGRPDLLARFRYGLVDLANTDADHGRLIANPGCFATGVQLALWPLTQLGLPLSVALCALTGATGSGAQPSAITHYPTRDSNVRAYKVYQHQHEGEILQTLGSDVDLSFVPLSGPWSAGIFGLAQLPLPSGESAQSIAALYRQAFAARPLVRLHEGTLPELRHAAGGPCIDIGWLIRGERLAIGFALDNLLKGAATQAIENLNLALGYAQAEGIRQ